MNQQGIIETESDDSGIEQTDLDDNEHLRTIQTSTPLKLTKTQLNQTTGTVPTEKNVTKTSISSGLPTDKITMAV